MTTQELESLSWKLRADVADIIMAGGRGHIGGDMSVLNALLVLYKNHLHITPATVDDPDRDRFVLSKGHAMESYYAVLADCGFLDLEGCSPFLRTRDSSQRRNCAAFLLWVAC